MKFEQKKFEQSTKTNISWVQVHLIAWPHKFGNSSHFFQPWPHKGHVKDVAFLYPWQENKIFFFLGKKTKYFFFLGKKRKYFFFLGKKTKYFVPWLGQVYSVDLACAPIKGTRKVKPRREH